ncbi:lipoyl(octanoyl) transferase LipB [Actinomycetaceae bacterium L2_0104]
MQTNSLLNQGPTDYMEVDALQRSIHAGVARLETPDTLLLWEARDVYTAGRRTKPEDIPDHSVPVIPMDRGGSVTYHGPGQLVVYPIIKVKAPKDVVAFVRATERAIIEMLASHYDVAATAIEGRSGVWIQRPGVEDKKLCAIGIKFADDATMHGLALNVSTDISKFGSIVPCGISDAGVTSLAQLGIETTLDEVADALLPTLAQTYRQFQRPERIEE